MTGWWIGSGGYLISNIAFERGGMPEDWRSAVIVLLNIRTIEVLAY